MTWYENPLQLPKSKVPLSTIGPINDGKDVKKQSCYILLWSIIFKGFIPNVRHEGFLKVPLEENVSGKAKHVVAKARRKFPESKLIW